MHKNSVEYAPLSFVKNEIQIGQSVTPPLYVVNKIVLCRYFHIKTNQQE
jgi:hypothetical protein